MVKEQTIYTISGTVPIGNLYIERVADQELLELCQAGELAFILSSRQVGKSSLMVRTAEELKKEDVRSVVIDLSSIGVNVSQNEWYLGILNEIANTLDLETDVFDWWETHKGLGPTNRLVNFFRDVLLKEVEKRVVLFFDEIDTTLSVPFSDDFFAALRAIYNARSTTPDFTRLSFVLIGVATPSDLISDSRRTPFNIGRRVELSDFTLEEAAPLAKGLGQNANDALNWVFDWTSGHPYLTQRLCARLAKSGDDLTKEAVTDTVEELFRGEGGRADNNLQFVRDMLLERAKDPVGVLRLYRAILRGVKEIADDEQSLNKSHLKLSGVVRRRNAVLRLSNRIYREVFNLDWIREHMPRFKRRRQVWLGTIIVALLVALLVAVLSMGLYRLVIYRPIHPLWVDVPAGEFLMGSDPQLGYRVCVQNYGEENCNSDWFNDEFPPHTVSLDAYQIMAYEVTNKEYRRCVQAEKCEDAGYKQYDDQGNLIYDRLVDEAYEDHPTVSVNWIQAVTYCAFIDARLPTEAEWEKAARGMDGRIYPWEGEEIDCSYANYAQYDAHIRTWQSCVRETVPVGSYEKGISPYGAYDLAGNVWEWTADWYDAEYYANSPASSPTGPESGVFRVLRGGSWSYNEYLLRASNRLGKDPSNPYSNVGFRCARSAP